MSFHKTLVLAVVVFALLLSASASAGLILQLKAAGYNPTTGTWTDTSGSDNHATQGTVANRPSLVTGMTPNGSSAVYFDGINDMLTLTAGISGQQDLTMFAYLMPVSDSSGTGAGCIVSCSGTGGAKWKWNPSLYQTLERSEQAGFGAGTHVLPYTAFSLIDVQKASGGTGSYRYNQLGDGSVGSGDLGSSPITIVGGYYASGEDENLAGYIAEIRIYNDVTVDRAAVENELLATYVPEPSALVLLVTGLIGLLCYAWRRRKCAPR